VKLLVVLDGDSKPPGQYPPAVIPVEFPPNDKAPDNVTTALLDSGIVDSKRRYPVSEWKQFWVVLKRTLLFSRRDWVRKYFHEFIDHFKTKRLSLIGFHSELIETSRFSFGKKPCQREMSISLAQM